LTGRAPRREPYARLARSYDAILGERMFALIRRNFEAIITAAKIRFRDAADLGCGTGIFAAYLCRKFGVPVTAVDRSADMLAEARRRCGGLRVRVLRMDLRHLRLPAAVELMTCNYDTLNHLTRPLDLLMALRAMRGNLRSGGCLFADFLTPALGVEGGGRHRFVLPGADGEIVQDLRFDFSRRYLLAEIRERRPGGIESLEEQHRERLYTVNEMNALLRAAGLAPVLWCNAETLGALDEATRRVVFLAEAGDRG